MLHCGPTLRREFCRSLTATHVNTSWTENRALRNDVHRRVLEAKLLIEQRLPFPLVGIDSDNGDVVRRYAFHYRYDTAMELRLLNELYNLVRIRFNLFTATTQAIG